MVVRTPRSFCAEMGRFSGIPQSSSTYDRRTRGDQGEMVGSAAGTSRKPLRT